MHQSSVAKTAAVAAVAVTSGLLLASGQAQARSGFAVVGVPYANPRAGVQNNVLTPSARQTSVAWGSLPLANPDTANGDDPLRLRHLHGGPLTQDPHEAFKTEPDKNVYLVLRRSPLPLPGPRGRPRRLRHAHRPRPGRPGASGSRSSPTPTPTGRACPRSTASPGTRSPTSCCSPRSPRHPRAACSPSRSTPHGDPATAAPAAHRARLRRLRGHPERHGRQRLARRGHRRRDGRRRRQGAEQLRLPVRPGRPDRPHAGGTLQALQVLRARRHAGRRPPSCRPNADRPVHRRAAHLRYDVRDRGSTVTTGRHLSTRRRRPRPPVRRRSSGPRTGSSGPGTGFREFYFTETGDTNTASTCRARFGGGLPAGRRRARAPSSGTLSVAARRRRSTPGSTTSPSPRRTGCSSSRTPATPCTQQRNALDSGYVVDLRGDPTGARRPGPADPLPRRGP